MYFRFYLFNLFFVCFGMYVWLNYVNRRFTVFPREFRHCETNVRVIKLFDMQIELHVKKKEKKYFLCFTEETWKNKDNKLFYIRNNQNSQCCVWHLPLLFSTFNTWIYLYPSMLSRYISGLFQMNVKVNKNMLCKSVNENIVWFRCFVGFFFEFILYSL